jgi:transcriptional regulator with XRE-family HTH domain/anti-sigma regulatory factor (Ser/Thr protein kinase)
VAEEIVSLAERLKQRRSELGISQAQAARELDVARTAYRLWEMEAAKPSPDRWRLIARWLGVSVTTMLLAEELISETDAAATDAADLAGSSGSWEVAGEAAAGDFFAQGRSMLESRVAAGHLTADQASTVGDVLNRLERGSPPALSMPWEPVELWKQLSSLPTAPSAARETLRFVAADVPQGTLEDATLLVSELVTNSVRHASTAPTDPIGVRIRVGRDVLRVDVVDRSPSSARPVAKGDAGYGLAFVAALATRWGAGREGGLNVTWFEMDLAQPGSG